MIKDGSPQPGFRLGRYQHQVEVGVRKTVPQDLSVSDKSYQMRRGQRCELAEWCFPSGLHALKGSKQDRDPHYIRCVQRNQQCTFVGYVCLRLKSRGLSRTCWHSLWNWQASQVPTSRLQLFSWRWMWASLRGSHPQNIKDESDMGFSMRDL